MHRCSCLSAVCATKPTTVAANASPFNCSATSLVNDKCVANCKDGFLGSPTVTCMSTGAWSAITGTCVASKHKAVVMV